MATRREAAQRKLDGPKPRRRIGLRRILVFKIIPLLLTAACFSLSALPFVFLGCFGEGLVCIQEIWNTHGSSLDGKFSAGVIFASAFFAIFIGSVLTYTTWLWLIQKTDLIRAEELPIPIERSGFLGLFGKKKKPPVITRHEMRN